MKKRNRNHRFARLVRCVLTLVLFAGVMSVASPGFAQSLKVGYVDLQRALNEVEEGKKAKAKLKKDFAGKQEELNKKQKEVKELKERLEAQSMMLSDEAKRKKAMQLQKKMYELQQLYVSLQGELTKKEASATKKIFDKMGTIIEKIAEEKGYDLILEKTESSVLYARDAMDLTDELIKRYDK